MNEVEIMTKLTEVEARSKSNTKRIDDMEKETKALNALASSVEVLAVKQKAMESDVQEIKTDVKSLVAKPAKRWDGLVDKAIYAIVGAVLAFWLARIGM